MATCGERSAGVDTSGRLIANRAPSSRSLEAFHQGLKEQGYVQGQNLTIEYRWANDRPERLPNLATDLVNRKVRVIATIGSAAAVHAAKAATTTIPIVFGNGSDPIEQGFIASLNRPGGNVTGMTSMSIELVTKQLQTLHDLLPQAAHFGVLSNPNAFDHKSVTKEAQASASVIGLTLEVLTASTTAQVDAVFAKLADKKNIQGLLVSNDPFFLARRSQLAHATGQLALPAIYPFREQVEAGGLMSYGANLAERDRNVGQYVGRILKGEKPADLPVLRPTTFAFVINLKTAKALGLNVPTSLIARADEVIE